MGRWLRAAGVVVAALSSASCNALLGIHELGADATTSGGDAGSSCPGVCQCVVDSDCAADHTACYDDGTDRLCACAPGYAMATAGSGSSTIDAGAAVDAGGSGSSVAGCVWSGVVADPEVDDPTKWSVFLGATVVPSVDEAGQLDPGEAQIQICSQTVNVQDGYITQTVQMPRRSRAQPLVLLANVNGGEDFGDEEIEMGIQLGNAFTTRFFDGFSQWEQARICIGAGNFQPEDAIGAANSVDVGAGLVFIDERDPFCGGDEQPAAIDHLEVVPAMPGECPDPGTVTNGDCEGSGGWTFESSSGSGDGAAIKPGVGENNSAGVELDVGLTCDFAEADVPMEVPVADGSGTAAISIYHSAAQQGFTIYVDGLPLELSGAQPTIDRYCVPAALRGAVTQLEAELDPSFDGETCGDQTFSQAVVDNVTLANDPLCGSDPYVADPGFESGLSLMGAQGTYTGSVAIASDPTAHGGTHDMVLSVGAVCGYAYYEVPIAAPPSTDTAGPALTFWYRYPPGSNTSMEVSNDSSFAPVRDGQWHQEHQCLPTAGFGRPPEFYVQIESTTGGTCGSAQTAETLSVDDLEIATDSSCTPATAH